MIIHQYIKSKYQDFKELMVSHDVKYMYAFGSSIRDDFNITTSDIDLIIEIDEPDPLKRGELLLDLWDELELFFNRKVDLLTESSVRNPILRESIDSTKVLIYDGEGQKILV